MAQPVCSYWKWRRTLTSVLASAARVVCLLVIPSLAAAQQIAGTVTDTSGAVLPGVTVEARSPALIEQVRTVTTNDQGQYPDRGTPGWRVLSDVHAPGVQYRSP